jgi:hypothetical protein
MREPVAGPSDKLYRFLYLNTERVRSIAAMVFGGVPEKVISEWQREQRAGAGVGINVPGLANADASSDVLFVRSGSETLALHHFLLLATIRKLEESNRITDVVQEADELPQGNFLRIDGQILIRDYAAVSAALDAISRIGAVSAHFQKEKIRKEQPQRGRPHASPELQKIHETERALEDIPSLRAAIDAMFEGVIRLYCSTDQLELIGSLEREHLIERAAPGLDPSVRGGRWTVLCEPDFGDAVATMSPKLSGIEKLLDDLLGKMTELTELMTRADARLIYPIAVYREL